MRLPHNTREYQIWVPFVARVILGGLFLQAAYYKIPGTEMFGVQVEQSGMVGIPFPLIAVFLAFILELVGGIALIIGWHTRLTAFLLAGFVLLINLFFYRNIADPAMFAPFMSNLGLIAGFLYISVYGAEHIAVRKDRYSR